MIVYIKKIFFINFVIRFLKKNRNLKYKDMNFRQIDFTNYHQIKIFIFKDNFYRLNNKNIHNFDFLNFSKKLGGKIGISLSKTSIFNWYRLNSSKLNYPWSDDLTSKRFINLLYNYEYVSSSSTKEEINKIDKIIYVHLRRVIFEFNQKQIGEITSFDLLAYLLSNLLLNRYHQNKIDYVFYVISQQVDILGMHKSYNVLEHAKFINNLNEIKSVFLYFKINQSKNIDKTIIKMKSILNQYFHDDGTLPLFNGSNNNYTKLINETINKDVYLKSRKFNNSKNGIAFYSDKNKKIFFDVVQPNKDKISSNLSAGTLSLEFSGYGEKIFTNCGASESYGKNPEYLRYSAAHSTIIIQNTNISEIKESNPHIKFPQSVVFNFDEDEEKIYFEGSHNGYLNKFNKILKRKIIIHKNQNKIIGEDSLISLKNINSKIIFHIRFHLVDNMSINFTNNKKNIILRTKQKNIWLFKSNVELILEDSILVDNNTTKPTKQIVIKGILSEKKVSQKWSLEKI